MNLVVAAHATLGDQHHHSQQNQDAAAHVEQRGADAAGGGQGVTTIVLDFLDQLVICIHFNLNVTINRIEAGGCVSLLEVVVIGINALDSDVTRRKSYDLVIRNKSVTIRQSCTAVARINHAIDGASCIHAQGQSRILSIGVLGEQLELGTSQRIMIGIGTIVLQDLELEYRYRCDPS